MSGENKRVFVGPFKGTGPALHRPCTEEACACSAWKRPQDGLCTPAVGTLHSHLLAPLLPLTPECSQEEGPARGACKHLHWEGFKLDCLPPPAPAVIIKHFLLLAGLLLLFVTAPCAPVP